MHQWLPLFPLQVVLLPGSELPLHIFEERYKEMIGDVRRERSEFGVVLASGQGIAGTGCTATIERVLREYPDGQLDILTLGRRRFEIESMNEDRSYLRCHAEFFDDDVTDQEAESASLELRQRAIESFNQWNALSLKNPFDADSVGHSRLSFFLARGIQDLDLRQYLLAARSESARLKRLIEFIPSHLERERRVEFVKQIAPRNGHGGKLNGIH